MFFGMFSIFSGSFSKMAQMILTGALSGNLILTKG